MLKIYNTLTKAKEEFAPQKPPMVKMYTCGVTVYDDCHIGHGRSLYIFEVIKRYLEYRGYKVSFVRNITDVDDKIINRARQFSQEKSVPLIDAFNQVRTTYIKSYYDDLDALGIPPAPREPLATENIPSMQKYISQLINKGFAYEAEGNVYFSVRKIPSYGKLSGKKVDELLSSVRIEPDPLKKDPLDFALWKKSKEEEPYWVSPWGKGRPGWHIECSVMSQKYLKVDTLDIHGGGRDLIFPHHENECAQAEALTAKPFSRFWVHHGLLTIEGQKMAKSLGNFVTIKDVLKKYPADILKFFYLQAHYSSSTDFSWEKMEEVKKAYERIDILRERLRKIFGNKTKPTARGKIYPEALAFKEKFIECMDDDFNTPRALAALFDMVGTCNKALERDEQGKKPELKSILNIIREIIEVFNLSFKSAQILSISDEEIEEKINLRARYKSQSDFESADAIRRELTESGIILEDTKDGTRWRRKI